MNRTIVLTDEQRQEYRQHISSRFQLNKIVCGDFTQISKQIPNEFADLILLDPPYNITKQYGETKFAAMSDDEYYSYILLIFKRCLLALKKNGTMYVCGDWKSSYLQRKALENLERNGDCFVINRITWARDKGRGALNNWKNNIEDIYMVVKDRNNYYFNLDAVMVRKTVIAPYKDREGNNKDWKTDANGDKYRMTCPSNVWFDITVPFWSMPENTEHPTQKSEKLYAKLILASSRKGDVVYEPFAGVFSGCVVAKKLGRNFCGIEREMEYCLLGQKRLFLAENDNAIQGYKDGFFKDKL